MGFKRKRAAKDEILAGRKETGATIAYGADRSTGFLLPVLGRTFRFRTILFAVLLIVISSIGTFSYLKFFGAGTYQKESMSIVEEIKEMATLATAEAVVTTVIKEEDNKIFNKEIDFNLPGTKRTLLLIVPATVMAGVDLKEVTPDNISVDEEKKEIELTLPHATIIQDPSIQMDKVQTYSEEGIFRSEVEWDKGYDLAAEAKEAIKKEATNIGLIQKAEDHAEKVLHQFFENLGYTVTINYQ